MTWIACWNKVVSAGIVGKKYSYINIKITFVAVCKNVLAFASFCTQNKSKDVYEYSEHFSHFESEVLLRNVCKSVMIMQILRQHAVIFYTNQNNIHILFKMLGFSYVNEQDILLQNFLNF